MKGPEMSETVEETTLDPELDALMQRASMLGAELSMLLRDAAGEGFDLEFEPDYSAPVPTMDVVLVRRLYAPRMVMSKGGTG
jgi:hypothetical protein